MIIIRIFKTLFGCLPTPLQHPNVLNSDYRMRWRPLTPIHFIFLSYFPGVRCETFKCPCLENGRCVRSSPTSQYRCICQRGYTGSQCEQFIGDCRTVDQKKCSLESYCQNTTVYGYTCVCPSHLSGDRCYQIGSCDYSPCLNNGSCISLGKGRLELMFHISQFSFFFLVNLSFYNIKVSYITT